MTQSPFHQRLMLVPMTRTMLVRRTPQPWAQLNRVLVMVHHTMMLSRVLPPQDREQVQLQLQLLRLQPMSDRKRRCLSVRSKAGLRRLKENYRQIILPKTRRRRAVRPATLTTR